MSSIQYSYDVIVIGGGHAGCEAALASARLGARTLLLTINMDHIAQMSCNPAVGGIAKGQVVREIDALGGAMGKITDAATIQFRMLNRGKGPAVWSPRAQCDKVCYQRAMKFELENTGNLIIHQAEATGFLIENGNICGVRTRLEETFRCRSVVVSTGTFLSGKLHYGLLNFPGGRAGDPPSSDLSKSLSGQLGIRLGRLKTGTPPRILAKTIDFSNMIVQESESPEETFSYFPEDSTYPRALKKEMPCYLVKSTLKTAEIIRANLDKSPMYSGKISGIGTRYCPSFEDKVVRFPHHETHLLYLEPEGEYTQEYYINGISTSLPADVQVQMLHSIPGLENAVISRYAYAIEYDFVFPDQINRGLAVKKWPNIFTAGQINGTSGYEEAAGQGLVAGLNAARSANGKDPYEFGRETSYIGVMTDDLVTKEIVEPYRLFTSRAEYRLILRQDNADLRLCPIAHKLGLLSDAKFAMFSKYAEKLAAAEANFKMEKHNGQTIFEHLKSLAGDVSAKIGFPIGDLDISQEEDRRILRQLVITAHYHGYIERELKSVKNLQKLENWKIPADFNYDAVLGLRNESRMKLGKILPSTLAQASRIDGVTPSELTLLQVHLKRIFDKKTH
ncbi:MAG TPA: tRNA uridine-5-carboxymethylaminomethyl(34) synthesis enzyme MnmG [Lentisphaeria bacterium]|nr:MAG: tRNA uridine-5-carboxymethylaminomethyl(34) synthesis enzyme MnmG [Lentisphaerae bacterium GWF2_50_93]HCE46364.1 tRNA uridine-5-carboxymethylaminomethyl(34) synthesis enzyme MnmG [Lentisphaeria bacterium]